MQYTTNVRHVADGNAIEVATGGQIRPPGGQAAAVTDLETTAASIDVSDTGNQQARHRETNLAVNAILAALRDIGVIAT